MGSRHVPCARFMASRKSAAVSSSQRTESRPGAAGVCAPVVETIEALDATRRAMESRDDRCMGSPLLV
jgi:hypothetical protein